MQDKYAKVNELIDLYRDEMLETLRRWISTPSVQGEAGEGMPFGPQLDDMLHVALDTVRGMGFEARSVDNYLMELTYGDGSRTLGVLGHLDTVPAGDGWTHDPFGAEICDGRMYGRGTSDDKGPMISALYGLKAVRDAGIPLRDRVRLLFGLNEETGSADMRYYKQVCKMPDYGFSPDADFPVINCEKGGLGLQLVGELKPGAGEFDIACLHCGERANIVPHEARATLRGISAEKARQLLPQELAADVAVEPGAAADECIVCARGIASHASLPEKGKNAAGLLAIALQRMGARQPLVDCLAELLGLQYDGANLGIKYSDDVSGALTCNLGLLRTEGARVTATLDIRYPITADTAALTFNARQRAAAYGVDVELRHDSKPLYVPEDHFVVQGLLRAYERVTGKRGYTIAIGGGTYSRSMDNCVAFGNAYPGTDNHIHMPDEFVVIDEFIQNARIYAAAIIELAGEAEG